MEISRDEARTKLTEAGAVEQPLGSDALWATA